MSCSSEVNRKVTEEFINIKFAISNLVKDIQRRYLTVQIFFQNYIALHGRFFKRVTKVSNISSPLLLIVENILSMPYGHWVLDFDCLSIVEGGV